MKKPALSAVLALGMGVSVFVSSEAHADEGPLSPLPQAQPAPPPPATQAPQGQTQTAPAPAASGTVDPCASACACATRCCSKCKCSTPKVDLSIIGARFAVTHVSAGPVDESTLGVGFAGAAETFALDGTTHGYGYFMLGGVYDPGEAGRRKLSGFEWRGFASMQLEHVRGDVSFMRIETPNTLNGTPVDVGRAQLCGVGGIFGVCLDGMLFHGDAEMRAEASRIRSTTSQYVGLTVGFSGW